MRGSVRAATSIVAAAITTIVLAPDPLVAHEESALYALAVVNEVSPSIDGLDVKVAQLTAPVVIAGNRTDEALIVEGVDGEPFLRIVAGKVETNLRSPTAYRAADPTGERPLPEGLEPDKPPRWTLLARRSTWSWFDPRIEYRRGTPNTWTIPGTFGGRALTISGGFEAMDGHGHFRTELDSIPQAEGLEIRMFDGLVPGMFARITGDEVLEIPGRQGEPFLEIGPRGVFGNERSPDFYASGGQTVRDVPAEADPRAAPRWKRLSREPVWSWLEYRARLPASAQHRTTLGTARHTILTWTTPVTFGGKSVEIAGHVEWIPPRVASAPEAASESALSRWGRPLLLALVVGALTTVLLRLRPRPARIADE